MMLLTEWGFDVMVHDPDAYIIKDPLQMYSDIIKARDPHIIAQKGKWPIKAKLKWGFSLVLGAVLYRSSTKLRKYIITTSVYLCVCIYIRRYILAMVSGTPAHRTPGSHASASVTVE